jgi:hypothetical protein
VLILHSLCASIPEHSKETLDPSHHRPSHCPQCEADRPGTAHGFYSRTLVTRSSTERSVCVATWVVNLL